MVKNDNDLPMEILKFTTRYDALQDRLCIDGEDRDGRIVSLWLTHRLLRRLIPALVKLITPVAESEDKVAVLAEWALDFAKTQQKPELPVTPQPVPTSPGRMVAPPDHLLISSIELKNSTRRVELVFCLPTNTPVATIEFNAETLRQWLSIVYRLWTGADWTLVEWPAWMQPPASQGTARALVH